MKRRSFLGMLGAAVATPFLPQGAAARAAKAAPYSAATVHAAIMHAQTRAVFSVWGLARALNVPVEAAEALMQDLAKRGVLGPLQGTTFGGRWASSKIMTHDAIVARMAQRRRTATLHKKAQPDAAEATDLTAMMAHLRTMAVNYFAAKGGAT